MEEFTIGKKTGSQAQVIGLLGLVPEALGLPGNLLDASV